MAKLARTLALHATLVAAGAIATGNAQPAIPLRTVAPPIASTREPLGLNLGLKQLSDGRLLFNDAGNRRLLLFDATLTTFTVVADTTGRAKLNYGRSARPFVAYLGDSSLIVDFSSASILVLDGTGTVARVAAPPKATDIGFLSSSRVLVDPTGSLVYRASYPVQRRVGFSPPGEYVDRQVDSAPVVRASFVTRSVDTIARIKLNVLLTSRRSVPLTGSEIRVEAVIAPFTYVDDWTVTSDGTIAVVRGADYHIDWINADGSGESTPKMSFAWLRVSDDEKRRLADSARAAEEAKIDSLIGPRASRRPYGGISFRSDVDGTARSYTNNATFVSASPAEIPDYFPPIRAGAVQADHDGNVWIVPNTAVRPASGGLVYDDVNRRGDITERVELPAQRSIAGFGRAGLLYLMWRDDKSVWHLEATRVIR